MGDGIMTKKRFTHKDKSLYIDDDYFCELEDGDEITELLNRQQYTVETVWKENEQLKKDCTALIHHNQEYRKENEHLKQKVESKQRVINAYEQYINDLKEDGVLE